MKVRDVLANSTDLQQFVTDRVAADLVGLPTVPLLMTRVPLCWLSLNSAWFDAAKVSTHHVLPTKPSPSRKPGHKPDGGRAGVGAAEAEALPLGNGGDGEDPGVDAGAGDSGDGDDRSQE